MKKPIRSGNTGFTLVEVLVSLVVFSIGLLGIGKLILFSCRANDSAYLRDQATALAYSILDSMRANRSTATAGGYSGTDVANANGSSSPCTAASSDCSGTTLAQYELAMWQTSLLSALGPCGTGTVSTNSATDPSTGASVTTATISVQWDDTLAQQTFAAATGSSSSTSGNQSSSGGQGCPSSGSPQAAVITLESVL
jgi:type IV pilus assembly protein PilV